MKKIELPLIDPLYNTYHYQGISTSILVNNPSIRNWCLNNVIILKCMSDLFFPSSKPKISIVGSSWVSNPHLEKIWYHTRFLNGYVHIVIRNLLDQGYYVWFGQIDDYYLEGKSWYKERHFMHDGLICGYNKEEKTYCVYAYDKNWVCRKFWISQKGFEAGRKAMFKKNIYGRICGIKPMEDKVEFCPETALQSIADYLDPEVGKKNGFDEAYIYGIAVLDHVAKYIGLLYNGEIPYEKTDRRMLRVVWEHKKAMLERIKAIEVSLGMQPDISNRYETLAKEANTARMIYASHRIRRRDSVLPIVQKKIKDIREKEYELLNELLEKTRGDESK